MAPDTNSEALWSFLPFSSLGIGVPLHITESERESLGVRANAVLGLLLIRPGCEVQPQLLLLLLLPLLSPDG